MRLDSGVEEGDAVDGRFDSMIAKLVVTGRDRSEALRRARRALAEARIEGVPTPLPFYREIVEHPDFTAVGGRFAVHNRWIEQEAAELLGAEPAEDDLLTVRVGRRLMVVPAPGLASLGKRAAPIRRESAALRLAEAGEIAGSTVTAPMQGTIVHVAVSDGQAIARGELVAVLEAMKMENRVLAHRGGIVRGIDTAAGESVGAGAVICRIEDAPTRG